MRNFIFGGRRWKLDRFDSEKVLALWEVIEMVIWRVLIVVKDSFDVGDRGGLNTLIYTVSCGIANAAVSL